MMRESPNSAVPWVMRNVDWRVALAADRLKRLPPGPTQTYPLATGSGSPAACWTIHRSTDGDAGCVRRIDAEGSRFSGGGHSPASSSYGCQAGCRSMNAAIQGTVNAMRPCSGA
jgi:hypothetical protein